MADGPTQHTPIDLRDVLIDGATVGGVRVVRIVCELEDGSKLSRVYSRHSKAIEQEDPDMIQTEEVDLTDKQKAVLQVIEKMRIGETLSVSEIAKRSGYGDGGDLRSFIKLLQKQKKLHGTTQGQRRVY